VRGLDGRRTCASIFSLVVLGISSPAQTFNNLASFSGDGGAYPVSSLVEGVDGNFYGTTSEGGSFTCLQSPSGCGTVFKITPGGVLTTLYSFSGYADGGVPAGLAQGSDGNFYGTTSYGGSFLACSYGCGTIFKITPAGVFTTLHTFCSTGSCNDGSYPEASLLQALNGDFYGATLTGGAHLEGTIFKVTPSGALTTVYSFCSSTGCTDGELPCSPLVQDKNGNFYGTANAGGANGLGSIFKMTSTGALSTLYSYALPADRGSCPAAGLVQGSDGNFYGTTIFGGTYSYGSVFKITPAGAYTTLYSFCAAAGCPDGAWPESALIQATDGNLYGVTPGGGGGLFQITTSGMLTPYPLPTSPGSGLDPVGGLLQATDGNLYGTTALGGASGNGTVFSFLTGLDPFISMLPGAAKLSATVRIIGNNLAGATQVTFNGTTTTFNVSSATQVIAKVPAGATTGRVQVTTPGGILATVVPFYVTPQLLSFSPASGAPGTQVTISGESLTQTQTVTFGGSVGAKFKVSSDTKITAVVPSSAVSGAVTVYTSGGKAVSATVFKVD